MATLQCHFQARCPQKALVQLVAVWMVCTFILFGSSAAVDPAEAVCRSRNDNSLGNNDEFQVDHQYDSSNALRAAGEVHHVAILYHRTSPENFEKILASGQMQPGVNSAHNYAGPGIFFTTTPEATYRQAQHKGVVLKCEVLLGLLRRIETPSNWAWDEAEHAKNGYDSLEIASLNGVDYVVYDPARIITFVKLDLEDEKPEYAAEDLNQTVIQKGPKNNKVSPVCDSEALQQVDLQNCWVKCLLFLFLFFSLFLLLLFFLFLVLFQIFDRRTWANFVVLFILFFSFFLVLLCSFLANLIFYI